MEQGDMRQPFHLYGQYGVVLQQAVRDAGFLIHPAQPWVPVICKARSVREQMLDRDLASGGYGLAVLLPWREHGRVSEFGDVFGDRVCEPNESVVVEHQNRDAGDRLCHRSDPENRFGAHVDVCPDVLLADALHICDSSPAGNHRDRTGEFLLLNVFPHQRGNLGKAIFR
jgi:hypothetical protein